MRDRFARVVSAASDTISDTGFDVCQCDITLEHIQTGIEHSIARWLAWTCAAPVPLLRRSCALDAILPRPNVIGPK